MAATLPATPYIRADEQSRSDMKDRPPPARRASPWADVVFSALAHGAAWLTLAFSLSGGAALISGLDASSAVEHGWVRTLRPTC